MAAFDDFVDYDDPEPEVNDIVDATPATDINAIFAEAALPVARAKRAPEEPPAGRREGARRAATKVRPSSEQQPGEFGTARSQRQKQQRILFRKHLERLMVIDPVATNIAAMRWLFAPWENAHTLTLPEIAELLGRAKSTVEGDLRAVQTRLLLLERCQPPDPLATYRPARTAGLSTGAASFAFWLAYTLSPERAAELSGYGRTGPASARSYVLEKLSVLGERDPRLRTWVEQLHASNDKLDSIRNFARGARRPRLASTTLGKRRNGLQNEQRVVPIPWLDGSTRDADKPGENEILKQKATRLHERIGSDPVHQLANALETDPTSAVDVAFELAGRDLPYFDTFRDR